jgi:hypothetical protein
MGGRARNLTIGLTALVLITGAGIFGLVRWRRQHPVGALPRLWVCGESLKVQPHTTEQTSAAFDPRRGLIRLYAARQEYVGFQIVPRAGSQPLRRVALRVNPLWRDGGPRGARIGLENLDLFYEHFLTVTVPSQNGRGEPVPGAARGEFPAQMVPLPPRKTRDGSGRYELPIEISAGRNQPVWVDIYVPEDQAPGLYRTEVEVFSEDRALRRLAVELTVWSFALPRETHFKTFCEANTDDLRWAFGCRDAEAADFRALEDQFFQMAHQHRINFNLSSNGTAEEDMVRRYRGYLDGSAFQARAGPGVGLNLWVVGLMGHEDVDGDDRGSVVGFARRVAALRRQHGWPAAFACYVLDEPHDAEEFAAAARRCAWVHEAAGSELPTYLTTPEWRRLPTGAVSIWGELRPQDVAGRQAAGQRVWAVNADYATGPYVDTPGTAGCALVWMAWRLGLDAWQFWNCCYWVDRQNLTTPAGEPLSFRMIDADPQRYLTDTWRDPLTFDQHRRPKGKQRDLTRINGDGVLFYPGAPAGVRGPLASFALKSLRRGLQDYEYLWLLRQRGVDTDAVVRSLVPRAGEWERSPDAWDAVRIRLGRMLSGRG